MTNLFNTIAELFRIKIDLKRVYGLDILRAFAILVVMYGHSRHFLRGFVNMKYYEFFLFEGVTIFFVLSGFLIGGILIKIINSTAYTFNDLFNFWIRRWFRTLPNYFLVLTAVCLLAYLYNEVPAVQIWKYYLFIQNFNTPHPYDFFPEAWSLSIEEWFYILAPCSLFIMIKIINNRKLAILLIIITFILFVTGIRLYKAIMYDCTDLLCWGNYVRNQVVTRLDSLMFGVLGAYVLYYYQNIFFKKINITFLTGVVLLLIPQIYDFAYRDLLFKNYFTFTLNSLGTLLMIPKLYTIKSGSGTIYKAITTISLISYSMYLLNYTIVRHYFFIMLHSLIPMLSSPNMEAALFNYVLFWCVTIIFSVLLYKYYEYPVTKLRDM